MQIISTTRKIHGESYVRVFSHTRIAHNLRLQFEQKRGHTTSRNEQKLSRNYEGQFGASVPAFARDRRSNGPPGKASIRARKTLLSQAGERS